MKIATLVSGRKSAGIHTIKFNGNTFASGVYFLRLKFNRVETVNKRIIILN